MAAEMNLPGDETPAGGGAAGSDEAAASADGA